MANKIELATSFTIQETKIFMENYRQLHREVTNLNPDEWECSLGPDPCRKLEDDEPIPSSIIAFQVFIYPRGEIYGEKSLEIEITLTPDFPMSPPAVRSMKEIFHPNVDHQGSR